MATMPAMLMGPCSKHRTTKRMKSTKPQLMRIGLAVLATLLNLVALGARGADAPPPTGVATASGL